MVATKQGDRPGILPYDNRNLFSDHYLETGAREQAEWREDVGAAWREVLELFASVRDSLPRLNEAQTEEEWVKPVLTRVLGWCYSVQHDATLFGRRNRPDYILYTSPEAKASANGGYETAAAVADAKYWARPLDGEVKDARNALTNANPSFQIVTYLVATGLDWGILTNGKEWRLYATRARSRVDTYFAVDLGEILASGDEAAFRWFHLFFRAAAFRDGGAAGGAFLDRVLNGSIEYGATLEERLKTRVYEDVFPYLAQGFVHWRREAGLPADTPEALREVYEGTLRLLYRLLFVLFAEARDFLPVHEENGYGRHGMVRIRRRVAEAVANGYRLSEVAADLWNDLVTLFRMLDRGDPSLNVPRYNGGLFDVDHPRNAFFATHAVADAWLYPALDRLARDADGHFIDYGSLSVQQLGSIYEGLLEYELRSGGAGAIRIHRDKSRRHGTGSYYTPQFIVREIVESALGPVLQERGARFRDLMADIAPKRERMSAAEANLAANPGRADAAATRWTYEANTLRPEVARLELEAAEALLGIRVCDPAMGSGHFLVHATEWITEQLVARLGEFPGNPVLGQVETLRCMIVEDLQQQGITVARERLKDAHLLRRIVVKRCIYGVDVNPMAVELAQLSLWLDSLTYGTPLSFLDHHLKVGNSLVGTTLNAVIERVNEAEQQDVFGTRLAAVLRSATLILDVASSADATYEQVARSSALYERFQEELSPNRALLDLWTSRALGNPAAAGLVLSHASEVLALADGGRNPFGQKERATLARAAALAAEHHFFHWDLEFVEIFYELPYGRFKDDPGFDAVIGNPPYVRQEQVGATKPYLAAEYSEVHDGAADLYVYFYMRGMSLLRRNGRLSYVVTNKWLRAEYGKPLRGHLSRVAKIEQIVDFGHAPVFPDADVFPCIVLLCKRQAHEERTDASGTTHVCAVPRDALRGPQLGDYVREHGFHVPSARFTTAPWSLEPPEVERLMEKIRSAGTPLGTVAGAKPYRGILTGFNEAYLVDQATRDRLAEEDPAGAALLKPFLRGQDVERWTPAWAGMWMILLPSGENHPWPWTGQPERKAELRFAKEHPAVHRHLKRFEGQLRARADRGQYWWELRSCAYYDAFARPKLIWKDLSFHSAFAVDAEGLLTNDLCFILPARQDHLWLAAVLNSPLMWWYAWRNTVHGKDEVLRLKNVYTEPLPIAPPPRGKATAPVARLIALSREMRAAVRELLEWLRIEFGVDRPGQRLEEPASLDRDGFIAEVKRRRSRGTRGLTPADVARLTQTYGEYVPRLREMANESACLEQTLAGAVNDAYGLTREEVALIWRTAPPRMPAFHARGGPPGA